MLSLECFSKRMMIIIMSKKIFRSTIAVLLSAAVISSSFCGLFSFAKTNFTVSKADSAVMPASADYTDESNGWRHFYNSVSGSNNFDVDDQTCLFLGGDNEGSSAVNYYRDNKCYERGYYLVKFAIYYYRGSGGWGNKQNALGKNSAGTIQFTYYSKHGIGSQHTAYLNSVVKQDNWASNASEDACAYAIINGFPDYAKAYVNFSSSSGTITNSTIWMEMYIYNKTSSSYTKISNGSGAKLDKKEIIPETETGNKEGTQNSFGKVIPYLASSGITSNNIELNNSQLSGDGYVRATATDQYGVTLEPDSFSVPFSDDYIVVSDQYFNGGYIDKPFSADYRCNSQSVTARFEVTTGTNNGRFNNTDQNSPSTVSKTVTASVTNNVQKVNANFVYKKSNPSSPGEPQELTHTVSVVPTVDIVDDFTDVPQSYYDGDNHYNFTGWDKQPGTTISEDTQYNALYTSEEHTFNIKTTNAQNNKDGSVYFTCDCGCKVGASYDSETDSFSPSAEISSTQTNLPSPEINSFNNDTYDYSKRGASLKLFDWYGYALTGDYLPLRFTASTKVPKNVSEDNIIDFGFVYTKAKYLNNGIDPITNDVYDYENILTCNSGNPNVYTLNIKSSQNEATNNYTTHLDSENNTVYTFNIVINEKSSNWTDHYVVRSFIKYRYGGVECTVYDDKYSSRSAQFVAQKAYADYQLRQQAGTITDTEKKMMNEINTRILSKFTNNLKMLKQSGKKIVNSSGKTVRLTGVNLGNWLLQEAWMGPINKGDADHWGEYDTYQTLVNRFGTEKADALMDTYRSNFLCETDLDYLQNLGVNCVRVPFWYENFTYSHNSYSDLKTDSSGESIGFSYLDWIIDECGRRNIYVLLDFHGLYGFQSSNHSTGRANGMKLFSFETSKGIFDSKEYVSSVTIDNTYLTANKNIWKAIAQRYKDNPVVAGYDIMNEPLNNDEYNFRGASSSSTYSRGDCYETVQNEIYNSIRSVDNNHLVVMEGIWDINELPPLSKYSWSNVAYSCHNYNYKKSEIETKVSSYNDFGESVPMIVGEWEASDYDGDNSNGNSGMRKSATSIYNNAGFSWITWTYKAIKKSNVGSSWYMKGVPTNAVITPETTSYNDIKTSWSQNVATDTAGTSTTSWAAEMSGYYTKLPS